LFSGGAAIDGNGPGRDEWSADNVPIGLGACSAVLVTIVAFVARQWLQLRKAPVIGVDAALLRGDK
jgi:hypothetical protein